MFEISKYIPELPVDSWWFFGAVLTALVVAIGLIIRFVSSKTDDIDLVEVDRQMLSSVRELTKTGEITDDEYRSIKGRLVERLKLSEDEQKSSEDSQTSEEIEDQDETESAIQQNSNDSDSDQSNPTI